jgi:hypothetical protein
MHGRAIGAPADRQQTRVGDTLRGGSTKTTARRIWQIVRVGTARLETGKNFPFGNALRVTLFLD